MALCVEAYAEFSTAVPESGRRIKSHGVGPGDTVSVLATERSYAVGSSLWSADGQGLC